MLLIESTRAVDDSVEFDFLSIVVLSISAACQLHFCRIAHIYADLVEVSNLLPDDLGHIEV